MAGDDLRAHAAPANNASVDISQPGTVRATAPGSLDPAGDDAGDTQDGEIHMNMQIAATAFRVSDPSDWEVALADYRAKRALSDAIEVGADGDDEAVDAYCKAMDHLIETIPAENPDQLSIKIDLALERSEGFNFIFEDYTAAICGDLEKVVGGLSVFAFGWLQRWSYLGGDAILDREDSESARIGWPAYDLSPVGAENEFHLERTDLSGFTDEGREAHINWWRSRNRSAWEGAIRELQHLMDAIPGGIAAMKALLRMNPDLGRGRRWEA